MINYILECLIFQCLFLMGYDLLLKRETFFQWNRAYLLGTFALAACLPFIEIEALRSGGPGQFLQNSFLLVPLSEVRLYGPDTEVGTNLVSWPVPVFAAGALVVAAFFGRKLWQLHQLKKRGQVDRFRDYTRVLVPDSALAFSFFRSIYLGDQLPKKDWGQIIRHEQVHVRQRHSLDLVFFECMKIIFWFNPLAYLYQARLAELHEYIADAQVPVSQRQAQYQLLLSQVFETRNISFINQFFTSSLIKKRIVMLKKSRSKNIQKLRYTLLVPLLTSMLWYSSCTEEKGAGAQDTMQVADIENLSSKEEEQLFSQLLQLSEGQEQWSFTVTDGRSSIRFYDMQGDSYISGPNNEMIQAGMLLEGPFSEGFNNKIWNNTKPVPFRQLDEVPLFPGCEDATDKKACFQEKLMRHIQKNFNYPQEAIAQGLSGRVNIHFIIDEYGQINEINTKGPHGLLEMEAERIIRRLPQMTGGKLHGKSVKVPFSLPITFKLD